MTSAVDARFAVRAGEFSVRVDVVAESGITVLFGPSGAGKSLTLATIAGLRRPDEGTVAINGTTVADAATGLHVRTQDRHIGFVFQESLLLPDRNVRDNVALAVRSRESRETPESRESREDSGTRPDRRREADELLALVGATDLADAAPLRLSGGERQRIALARALVGKPALLLLDEPFSALDHATRRTMRTLLRDVVTRTGVPTLLVTHDLDEAAELADHTISFADGTTAGPHVGFPRL
jgi:molybdate transport system ATP-binding protein